MSAAQLVLDAVRRLYSRRPLRVENVAAATGTRLNLDRAHSNQYFTIYLGAGKPGAIFTEVEARIPTTSATAKDGLVVITVNKTQSCIGQDEVMREFKAHPELHPSGPAESLVYLVYRFDWGVLNFGFPTRGRACLSSIVVDATGA
jgi:hypothetical protein